MYSTAIMKVESNRRGYTIHDRNPILPNRTSDLSIILEWFSETKSHLKIYLQRKLMRAIFLSIQKHRSNGVTVNRLHNAAKHYYINKALLHHLTILTV